MGNQTGGSTVEPMGGGGVGVGRARLDTVVGTRGGRAKKKLTPRKMRTQGGGKNKGKTNCKNCEFGGQGEKEKKKKKKKSGVQKKKKTNSHTNKNAKEGDAGGGMFGGTGGGCV